MSWLLLHSAVGLLGSIRTTWELAKMQIPRPPAPREQSPCRWAGTWVTFQVTDATQGREHMFSHEKHLESFGN